MKKILNPYLNKEGYNCVCCAPNNPVGLHLEFWEEGEDVLTIWNPGENYQGRINTDRKSTRLNSSHTRPSRMPSSA